jgi:hypothetical protein
MDLEQIIDDILSERVSIYDLNNEQLEAVTDHMRETFTDMIDSGDEEEMGIVLLELLEQIEDVIENQVVAGAAGNWTEDIESSIARGNTYFEMENYVVQ